MGVVRSLPGRQEAPLDPPSDGGDDGGMERLRQVEQDVAVIKATMATEAGMHKAIGAQTWKIVSAVIGWGSIAVTAAFFIARHVQP